MPKAKRAEQPTRSTVLAAEVRVEMDLYARVEEAPGKVHYQAPQSYSIPPNRVKHPPWRRRWRNGRLGGWLGPMTPTAYDAARARYSSSFHGVALRTESAAGGLWDYERQPWESLPAYEARTRGETRPPARGFLADEDLLHAFWESGADVSPREMLVYAFHVIQGLSRRETSRRMGITPGTMLGYLKELRERAQLWHTSRGTLPSQSASGWDEPPTTA